MLTLMQQLQTSSRVLPAEAMERSWFGPQPTMSAETLCRRLSVTSMAYYAPGVTSHDLDPLFVSRLIGETHWPDLEGRGCVAPTRTEPEGLDEIGTP